MRYGNLFKAKIKKRQHEVNIDVAINQLRKTPTSQLFYISALFFSFLGKIIFH